MQAIFVLKCRALAQGGANLQAVLVLFDNMVTDYNSNGDKDYFKQLKGKQPRLHEVSTFFVVLLHCMMFSSLDFSYFFYVWHASADAFVTVLHVMGSMAASHPSHVLSASACVAILSCMIRQYSCKLSL